MVSKLIYLLLCWILHLFWILIWKIFVFFQSFVIWCTQNIFSWVTPLIKGQVKTNAKNKYKTKSLSSFFSSILLCDEIRQVLLLQKKHKTKNSCSFLPPLWWIPTSSAIAEKNKTKTSVFSSPINYSQSFLVLRPKGAQLSSLFLQMFSLNFRSSNDASPPKDSNKMNFREDFTSSKS